MHDCFWMLAGERALLSRCWAGEHVVYHPAAGDTHLLGDAAVDMLALLDGQALDSEALSDAMRRYCTADESRDVLTLTNAMLADLEALGLIERTAL
ncbi:MAG: HPr-rel-A system PqqD family peptide chaperone [Herminiimonas sp.]|nr:HPr-rel-A system PqqD family peptide chaperone [Herminiimonas sp.]